MASTAVNLMFACLPKPKLPKFWKKKLGAKEADIGWNKCSHPKCAVCPFAITGDVVHVKATGVTIPLKKSFSCSSSNVVYIVSCTKCGRQG